MDAVWVDELHIGTTATTANPPVWTYSKLCKGISGMNFSENEQNQQNFFLCGKGGADNDVTGIAPELVITGKRIVGDAAQDYVAGLQFKLGDERRSSVKVITGGLQITCDCTIGNITSFGGNAVEQNAFGCTIRFNGIPVVTTAPQQGA
jgi:hypothetical protein